LAKILLINNLYTESENLRAVCKNNHFSYDEYRHTELSKVRNLDDYAGAILSGTGDSPDADLSVYADEISLLGKLKCPVLGICGGAQIIALANGGEVIDTFKPIAGRRQVLVSRHDPLFAGLPTPYTVLSKHRRWISKSPDGFEVLAREACDGFPYVFRKTDALVYAVQFHPERRNDGTRLMANFFSICRQWFENQPAKTLELECV